MEDAERNKKGSKNNETGPRRDCQKSAFGLLCKVRKTMLKNFLDRKLLSSLLCDKHFSSKKFVKFNFFKKARKRREAKNFPSRKFL